MPLSDWKALFGLGVAAVIIGIWSPPAAFGLLGIVALVTVMTHPDTVAGWFGQTLPARGG